MKRILASGTLFLFTILGGITAQESMTKSDSELVDGGVDTLKQMFNHDQERPRLILLLSPT